MKHKKKIYQTKFCATQQTKLDKNDKIFQIFGREATIVNNQFSRL